MERELPLLRCVLAHGRLAAGDLDGAIAAAASALVSAEAIGIDYPLALCLETAALVAREIGAPDSELASALASASVIRDAGARPIAAGLAPAITALRARVGRGEALDPRAAAELATRMLARRVSD